MFAIKTEQKKQSQNNHKDVLRLCVFGFFILNDSRSDKRISLYGNGIFTQMGLIMWIVLRTGAILWFLYFLFFVMFVSGLHSENESVIILKTALIVQTVLMALVIILFVFTSVRVRQREINKKLRISLNAYFRKQNYALPIVDFAEENKVKVREAVKFIDYIMDFYGDKLDIDEKGIIKYSSKFKITRKDKKRKKRRR